MEETDRVDEGTGTGAGLAADVVASTLEALQARIDASDRQALRGAIEYAPPSVPPPGTDPAR